MTCARSHGWNEQLKNEQNEHLGGRSRGGKQAHRQNTVNILETMIPV